MPRERWSGSMDEQRRATCRALIRKKLRGEQVSSEEVSAVWPKGLLAGMGRAEAEEEARLFLRYYLGGADLSDIDPRGWEEAKDWFATREKQRPEVQTERLRNMIEASDYDRDYWDALVYISMMFLAERKPLPARLAGWNIENLMELRHKPRRRRGNKGQPPYAKDRRNKWIAGTFSGLQSLGLAKMEGYRIIADEIGLSQRTVMKAIRSVPRVPRPWESWSWPREPSAYLQAILLMDD